MTVEPAPPFPQTIPLLLAGRAGGTPDAVACYHRGPHGVWVPSAWRELAADVRRTAASLRAAGVRKGDRVAVTGRTGREWWLTELAILSAGAVVVGIDPHAPREQAAFVLGHAGARFLVADTQQNLERIPAEARGGLAAVAVWGGAAGRGDAPAWETPDRYEVPGPTVGSAEEPSGADTATLVYTAGTTGTSKGIAYTHRHLLAACRAVTGTYPQLRAGDTTVCWLPMAHLFQRMLNLWAVAAGMTTYFVDDPRSVADSLRSVRPSFFAAVPRFYEKFAQNLRSHPDPASAARDSTGGNVKFMLTGTAPLPRWVGEFLHSAGLLVLEAYGVTEDTIPLAANRVDACRFGSVGRPCAGNELRLDPADGEVLVRGEGVFDGYYKEEVRPPHLFTADGFYRTGDLGAWDADGFLYLVGRKAEVIKTSTGRRVSPARVEAVYAQSPYIDHVVVFGHGRAELVALVTLKADAAEAALRADPTASGTGRADAVRELIRGELHRLGRALPAFERVRRFDVLPEPLSVETGELTPTLKLYRGVIAARHAARIEGLYRDGPHPPSGRRKVHRPAAGDAPKPRGEVTVTPEPTPPPAAWSYEEAFRRNRGLIGEAEQERLKNARVAIAGMGGVGGVHLITLARLGVGGFTVADPDAFEVANFNRQCGATVRSLGRNKAEVMAEEALAVNPSLRVRVLKDPVTPGNVGEFLDGAQVFLDGIDFFALPARRLAFREARARGVWAVTAGPIGFSTAWLTFSPTGMSFDEYFDLDDSMDPLDQMIAFLVGLTPRATHRDYMDMTKVDPATGRGPSAGLACQLCSGVAAAEVMKILLGRDPVRPAPYYFQFDAYRQILRRGLLRRGNRHPMQRLKRRALRKRAALLGWDKPPPPAAP